jgi:SAM-dependent methyltransferase
MMASIFYRFPRLYNLMLLVNHKQNLAKRYEAMAEEIGAGKRVLELGCGTALLAEYLHEDCQYEGWDLNPRFVRYAARRGVRTQCRDILEADRYPDCDVIAVCDVLHHVYPRHEPLIRNALNRAGKVVVLEPYNDCLSLLQWAFDHVPQSLLKFIDSTVGDGDGINPYDERIGWQLKFDKQGLIGELRRLQAKKIIEVGKDLLAVFEKT